MKRILTKLAIFVMMISVLCFSACTGNNSKNPDSSNNFQKEDGEPGDTTKEEIIDGEKGKITSAPDKPEEEIPDNITPEPLNIPKVSEISKGITLYLGLYEQDNVVENGLEPIEWQVLDVKEGKALLLSKYILEPLAYGDSLFLGGAPYASSIVRAWLYESFYNISFSSEEKEIMKQVLIENSEDAENYIPEYEPTEEKVFILSKEDVLNTEYGFSDTEDSLEERVCYPTLYAFSKYLKLLCGDNIDKYDYNMKSYMENPYPASWWLRTAKSGDEFTFKMKSVNCAYYVYERDGSISTKGFSGSSHDFCGVRPALWIDVNAYLSLQDRGGLCIGTENQENEREVDISIFKNSKQGDVVEFGESEQDNNFIDGREPIKWIVLENDGSRVLLLSKYVLDCRVYNYNGDRVTWEDSAVRQWLNADFYENSFNSTEKKFIMETLIKNEGNKEYDIEGDADTRDKVFFLSIEEAMNPQYGFSDSKKDDLNRRAAPTDYAKVCGCYSSEDLMTNDSEGSTTWLLRSPGNTKQHVATVDYGDVFSNGWFVNLVRGGVRPAIYINLAS